MSGVMEGVATVMGRREAFTVAPSISPVPVSQPQLDQQIRVPYGGADGSYGASQAFETVTLANQNQGMNLNSGDQKRKRGRPRKYGPDGSMAIGMASAHPPPPPQQQQPISVGEEARQLAVVEGSASPGAKKPRGRPPGSSNKKKQIEAIGSTGIGFIPHVINVKAGEDVCSKVMAFSQNGPRAVCILSANGAVSNVTLRQAATSGGTATFEGRFDILSLSGSFMVSDVGGHKSRTGGLSTTLAGPDGRVFGGCVAGLFIADSPLQVIVGSFIADGRKEPKSTNNISSAPPKVNMGASSSPSRGTFSESSGGHASPLNLSSGACNNNQPLLYGLPWK